MTYYEWKELEGKMVHILIISVFPDEMTIKILETGEVVTFGPKGGEESERIHPNNNCTQNH